MSGALLLGFISLVAIVDLVVALRFRTMADNADVAIGSPKAGSTDPAAYRRVAGILLISAPLMWLFIALLAFGIFPNSGIIPIKF